ncbi:hypothetical protein [Paraclostridium bifermentans]|uniref:hypothetical protein n=1 Tax=Paraclostridium bifermentans TaxID=1490 RepID=UPI000A177774|nr:hypothetical protein [Paraclostridium bifermentans]OSB12055.1 hypothetical protein B2H97_02845 [Paraclostridium bifermentans]
MDIKVYKNITNDVINGYSINDSEKYEEEANYVKEYINKNMYDIKTGYYYDLQINQDKYKLLVNRGKGTEGFIPIYQPKNKLKQLEIM